jgi:beta-galactosidase
MALFFRYNLYFTWVVMLITACNTHSEQRGEPRKKINFNENWWFVKSDISDIKDLDLDNQKWRPLDLPHDWAIEGPFTEAVSFKGGYLPYPGVGWYKKIFNVAATANQLSLEFDGVMRDAKVWLNGECIGGWPYGYTSFSFDISEKVNRGSSNTLLVRVENQDHSSRWYPGSGIYRNVWLTFTNEVRIATWGTFVTTPEITDTAATVKLEATVENKAPTDQELEMKTYITDQEGQVVASQSQNFSVKSRSSFKTTTTMVVKDPRLWDLASPYLYKAVHRIFSNEELLDSYETTFGIRSFYFDADQGFFLNGKSIKLQGVNLHHDLGPLGAAVNRRATERQLEIMKEMGVNAIRTAHNPPSVEQLELCDEMGILVINETFDTWDEAKYDVENDYSIWFDQWALKDTEALVRRDRNHPSVILWSIGNEVMNMGTETGKKNARAMANLCRRLDPTRPVMAGVHLSVEFDQELREIFDVFGMNYWQDRYDQMHARFPDFPLLASESAASLSSRGVYHFPPERVYQNYYHESRQITSYDLVNTGFGALPDDEFAFQKAPWMAGQFVWSGFDYHGEPDPYEAAFPAHSSYFGIVDMAGFKKDRFFLYQSQWSQNPMIHLLPHWNWPGREGERTPVYVYSNCSEVELIVNGKSQGKRKKEVGIFRYKWEDIKYYPGSIKAVGYHENGKALVEKEIRTAGPEYRIMLEADRGSIWADGNDLSFITAKVVDQHGNICPDADNMIEFTIEGAGRLAAVGNGDPTCFESYQKPRRSAFHGKCLLIVKSTKKSGEIIIGATSNGLQSASLKVLTQESSSP